jgi:hypothetical protein
VAKVTVSVAASLPLLGATVSQLTVGPTTDHLRFFLVVVTWIVRGEGFVPATVDTVREVGVTESVWADAATGANTMAQRRRHRESRENLAMTVLPSDCQPMLFFEAQTL